MHANSLIVQRFEKTQLIGQTKLIQESSRLSVLAAVEKVYKETIHSITGLARLWRNFDSDQWTKNLRSYSAS